MNNNIKERLDFALLKGIELGKEKMKAEIIGLVQHLKYELEMRDWVADELIKQINEVQ